MKEGAPRSNAEEPERPLEEQYPQLDGESNEDYDKRLSDIKGYSEMAEEDGVKAEAEAQAAEAAQEQAEYANSKIGKYEAYLRSKQEKGVYKPEEVDAMLESHMEKERLEKWLAGERPEDEFAGETVRGDADGAINFDMYPRQKGETPEEYGKRLKEMSELMQMAQEDAEKDAANEAAAKEAEDYAVSKLGKYEAYLRKKQEAGVYKPEEVDKMVADAKERFEDEERYEQWMKERAKTEEDMGEKAIEATKLEGDDAENADDAGEAEKSPEELRKMMRKALWEEGDFSATDLNDPEKWPDDKLKEAYDEMMKKKGEEGADADDDAAAGEDEGGKPEEKGEKPERSPSISLEEFAKKLRKVEDTRAKLAELSAKRRGIFGKKHGGAQEEAFNAASSEYETASVDVIKSRIDEFRNNREDALRLDIADMDPEEAVQKQAEIDEQIEKEVNAKFIELWVEENKRLIEQSKDRMDNGGVVRKIGKMLDKMPKWGKIALGIGLGTAIGVATGGLGLTGAAATAMAVGTSAGQAALFTRGGSKYSEVNRNTKVFESEKVKEEFDKLPKDQRESYDVMAAWMTKNHSEALLKDKYDNRKRTAIGVGAAVAMTLTARAISGALSNRGGGGGEGAPLDGGGETPGNVAGGEGAVEGATDTVVTAGTGEMPAATSANVTSGVGEAASMATPEFSASALRIDPGEGMFQTLREAGIGESADQWTRILSDPDVQRAALDSGLAHTMDTAGGLGLNLGADGALQQFLEIAKTVAENKGII